MTHSTPCFPLGEQSLTPRPKLVLDTNAVLDWLLFDDPGMRALGSAVAAKRVQWLVTPAMNDEFRHVLQRGLAAERGADGAALDSAWRRHAVVQAEAPAAALRCADADDQKFLDLALATGAKWLISRDRALLTLTSRAAALGLAIGRPYEWRAE